MTSMQSIGERLEEARKSKGIAIGEAAEATKLRTDYLEKFESNQFDINLPSIYVRGFLGSYASYLGLSAKKLLHDYQALGRDKPEPKPVNRENYGRLDLTMGNPKEPAHQPDESKNEDDSERTSAPFRPSISMLPSVDRALLVKGGIVLAITVVVVVLIVIVVRALGGGEDAAEGDSGGVIEAVAIEPQVVVHALGDARIKIVDETSGTELFQGSITAGDSQVFPKSPSMLLTADPIENVEIEMDGQRYPTGLTGRNRIRIQ